MSLLRVLGLIICRPLTETVQTHLEMLVPFYSIQKLHFETPIDIFSLPLFNDEGLPVFNSASGIPTVFWPSFAFIVCFLFLPRLFS